jgi:hypothetical protein
MFQSVRPELDHSGSYRRIGPLQPRYAFAHVITQ